MTTIKLKTADQDLFIVEKPRIASGDQNSVQLYVEFDEKWNEYIKTAVFYTDKDPTIYEAVLTKNTCIVPYEVLEEECVLHIGVRGIISDEAKVKTSDIVKYAIL